MNRPQNPAIPVVWFSCLTLRVARAIDVLLGRSFIFADKVVLGVLAEPDRELGELLAQTRDRLLVHSGLGNELRQRYCGMVSVKSSTKKTSRLTYEAAQVLGTVGIANRLVGVILAGLLPDLANLVVLRTLEAVKWSERVP